MSAFNKIMEIVTASNCKNGHALRNIENQNSLAKAQKEIEEMLKTQNTNQRG